MALEFSYENDFGILSEECYATIDSLIIQPKKNLAHATVLMFYSRKSYGEKRKPLSSLSITVPIDRDANNDISSVISNIYAKLKQEKLFLHTIDV